MDFLYHKMLQSAILAFLTLSKCLFLGIDSASLSIVTDKEALISLKSQLILEPPNPLSSWDINSSPCNWTRVVCNKNGERVIGLDLSDLGLKGSITTHIGNLSFLESLQLQNNQFTGKFPDQICNLFRLRVMNMSSNSIQGTIPQNISNLIELRVLDLMGNRITGTVPEAVSRIPNLQVLKLGKNLLWGAIPPSMANLSQLTHLDLGTNTLTGAIPSDLGRLPNLQQLDLTINNLTGTVPPSIYNMSSLVYLALASNNLWGKIPGDVGDTLPKLTGFNFCFNKFTGTIPASLHNRTDMEIFRIAHNLLEGTVPPGLENLPNLRMYNIGFNKIVRSGENGISFVTSLANSTRLNFLAFDGNNLEGVIPDSIGNLSKVLSKLYMGGNRIRGEIPASIGDLTGLALLNLSYNLISGQIPAEIGQLEELQELVLAGNQISGGIPNSLGNLKKLNQVDLSGNKLVGNIPNTFGNFQNLLSMDLSNNKFNGSIPREVFNAPSLSTILNLSNNILTGPLPQEIGLLPSIVTIDLSSNLLSGNIPSSISSCKSLEELIMARNILSGPIPASLGEMNGLETIDLSSNQLSGLIPDELQKLQGLRFLNLSFNNLEGKVPSDGVFRNLSIVHLEGNPKLCLHSSCDNNRGRRRSLSILYIFIPVMAAMAALCFVIGIFLYRRKTRTNIIGTSESLIKEQQHQIVSYNDLREATANFSTENLIGSGGFGSVYKGYLRELGIGVAVKVLDVSITGSWKSFFAECEALRNVRHRNLVKLITSCSSLDFKNMEFLALVYEFLKNGSLEDWISGKRKHPNGDGLNVIERLDVAIDVASAMDYLHHDSEFPVVHCDLKPSNIILDEDMTAKVGDFGLARLVIERTGNQHSISSTHALKGSIGYIPPEYGLGVKPSTAGDVYSFGVLLLELFTGKSPTHESLMEGLSLIRWVQSGFPTNILRILDPQLLLLMESLCHQGEKVGPEIQTQCLTTVIGVGLACTADSPDGRIDMRAVLHSLQTARHTLLKSIPVERVKRLMKRPEK